MIGVLCGRAELAHDWCCSHCGTLLSCESMGVPRRGLWLACADCVVKSAPFVVRPKPRCHRVATLPQLPDRADGNVLIQFQSCEAANFWATGYSMRCSPASVGTWLVRPAAPCVPSLVHRHTRNLSRRGVL